MDDNMVQGRGIADEVPDNLQQPVMYQHTIWILGAVALVSVLAIAILTAMGKDIDSVVTGLVAIAASAVGGLVNLLLPKKQA